MSRRVRIVPSLLAAGAAVLAGCTTVGPSYQRPTLDLPAAHRGASAAEAPGAPAANAELADQAWWEVFRDDALAGLIAEALQNNGDVRQAAWRVEEARANAGIAAAQRAPAVQGSVEAGRGRTSKFSSGEGAEGGLVQWNVSASWEIDFWGRVRRLNEAARARYLATEEARRSVYLSLVAEVASDYFELRQLDLELDIARRTSGAFQETYDLFNRRLEGGAASALETESAKALLASTEAAIPDFERQIAERENELSFLLGRNPGPIARGAALAEQFLPPAVPPGLPSALLERRPDLRQSEQSLIAANADVGVATADLFPRISLTGAFGGVAPQVSEIFPAGRTWTVGGGLLTPLFQGRRLSAERQAAVARFEQAKASYEESVRGAFRDAATALVAYQKYAEVEAARQRQVTAYREAARLANTRYVSGLSDYLEVLQVQQQLFPAEIQLAQARFNRLDTLVQLYRALGGGWKLADAEWLHAPAAGAAPTTEAAAP